MPSRLEFRAAPAAAAISGKEESGSLGLVETAAHPRASPEASRGGVPVNAQ
jgi:hypothetical protein